MVSFIDPRWCKVSQALLFLNGQTIVHLLYAGRQVPIYSNFFRPIPIFLGIWCFCTLKLCRQNEKGVR